MSKLNSSHGFISLLYSIGDNPLGLWSKHVSADGRIRRVEDDTLNGDKVIEIRGNGNSSISTNISCPASPEDFLNIQLPVLAVVLKNLNARIQIAFQLIDEENIRRKFILSTCDYEKTTGVEPETARLPLKLDDGWNLLEINLGTLCQTTYRTEYRALQRLIIYPNCRVRRIYLQDRHYEHNETPVELCQAFFDMYMLKWGIHFVEKSCQTNETYKDFKSVIDEKQSVSLSENPLPDTKAKNSKNTKSASSGKLLSSKSFRSSSSKVLTKKSRNSSNDNTVTNTDKKIKILKPEPRKRRKLIDKVEENKRSSAIAWTPIKVDTNLKTNEGEGEIFRKWPFNYVPLHQIGQDESNKLRFIHSAIIDAKNPIIVTSLSSTFPERKSTRARLLKTPIAIIPSEVEAEATEATKDLKSTNSKLLTTDEAVGNFLELRHVINRKMLENFRVRGLTMTEVELSIYNSKHRRNSYGQGKLVEKHRVSVDKACNVISANNSNETKTEEISDAQMVRNEPPM